MNKMRFFLCAALIWVGAALCPDLKAQVIMPSFDKPAGETVYNSPDEKASLADAKSNKKWEEQIDAMVKLPASVKKTGMEGRVIYRVLIEKDGTISKIEPIMLMLTDVTKQKLGVSDDKKAAELNAKMKQECVQEGVRCIKALAACKPAKQEGKVVRSFATISASFRPNSKK